MNASLPCQEPKRAASMPSLTALPNATRRLKAFSAPSTPCDSASAESASDEPASAAAAAPPSLPSSLQCPGTTGRCRAICPCECPDRTENCSGRGRASVSMARSMYVPYLSVTILSRQIGAAVLYGLEIADGEGA